MSSAKPYELLLNQAVHILLKDRPDQLCGVVTNFLTDQFVVRFPQPTQLPEELVPGFAVVLRTADAAGMHSGKSEVVERFPPPRPGLVLKNPHHFDLIQNRRFFRVEVDFPGSVQHIGETGTPMARDMDDKARIRDLSAGGARVTTVCKLVVGEHVQLSFIPKLETGKMPEAPGATTTAPKTITPKPIRPVALTPAVGTSQTCPVVSPSLQLSAKVVRVNPLPDDQPGLLQVGLEFEKLTNRAQDRLVTLIFDVQRGQAHRR